MSNKRHLIKLNSSILGPENFFYFVHHLLHFLTIFFLEEGRYTAFLYCISIAVLFGSINLVELLPFSELKIDLLAAYHVSENWNTSYCDTATRYLQKMVQRFLLDNITVLQLTNSKLIVSDVLSSFHTHSVHLSPISKRCIVERFWFQLLNYPFS